MKSDGVAMIFLLVFLTFNAYTRQAYLPLIWCCQSVQCFQVNKWVGMTPEWTLAQSSDVMDCQESCELSPALYST